MEIYNNRIYIFLREIRLLNLKTELTRSELSRMLHVEQSHPLFRKSIDILVSEKIILEIVNHHLKLLKIDNDKLESFIRKYCSEFKEWGKFIEITKPTSYNY